MEVVIVIVTMWNIACLSVLLLLKPVLGWVGIWDVEMLSAIEVFSRRVYYDSAIMAELTASKSPVAPVE